MTAVNVPANGYLTYTGSYLSPGTVVLSASGTVPVGAYAGGRRRGPDLVARVLITGSIDGLS